MSTFKVDTLQSTTGGVTTLTKQSAAKAWVNFAGNPVAVNNTSLNISSIDDDGTGQYGVNFTSAMSNATYSPIVSHDNGNAGGTGRMANFHTYTTNGADIDTWYTSAASFGQDDPAQIVAAVHGDLA